MSDNYQHKLRTDSQERRLHAYYEIFQLDNCNGGNDRRTWYTIGVSGCISFNRQLQGIIFLSEKSKSQNKYEKAHFELQ